METSVKNRLSVLFVCILFTAFFFSFTPAFCADWPNYRGPSHDNISTETDIDFSKVKEGLQPLWKANINTGFSAISISGGRVYSVGNSNDTDIVCCLDALTGKEIWKHEYPEPLNPQMYEGGCNATPAVADGKVYTFSKTGKVFCLDAASGEVIWKKELSSKPPQWGFSGSALVTGDLVVFNAGTTGAALNKNTGDTVWQSASDAAGYATPVPYKEGSVLIFAARGVAAVNLSDGKILFESPWPTRNGVNAADPLCTDDKIFITSGYNQGCALLQATGSEVKQVYTSKNMRSHLSGPVLIDGYLYGMDDKQLACLEMAAGDLKWTAPEIGKGTIMAVGKKLVVLSETGKLYIANAAPASFDVITSAQILSGKCWTMPSIANGLLYARNATGDLVCIDLRAAAADSAAKTSN